MTTTTDIRPAWRDEPPVPGFYATKKRPSCHREADGHAVVTEPEKWADTGYRFYGPIPVDEGDA